MCRQMLRRVPAARLALFRAERMGVEWGGVEWSGTFLIRILDAHVSTDFVKVV